jgi:2-polyprenyl-3-methyl-5-hydroxy-6-metoxy-1,4-benzoquinol methylase
MSGGGNANALAEKSRASLRERFMAWWEGYELGPHATPRPQPAAAQSYGHAVRYERNRELWETSRITLVQQVWGEGFTTPGGADHIMSMIKYFGLDPAMSVLDIGAALGGAGRLMSGKFGVWVSGLEIDPQLVEAATALSTKAGLAKKAVVEQFQPDSFSYKAKSIDCVFSKEFFFTVRDKMAFLRTVEILLKPRGQLLFTDYVLAKPHLKSKALDKWKSYEPVTPHPWAVEDYQEVLGGLHLDIRVVEDITETHRKIVTKGWADYLSTAKRGGVQDGLAPALVDEVELWTRRIHAIEAGDLKVARIHALKKDTNNLMSDW